MRSLAVDCGKASVVAIFLFPMPEPAIIWMVSSSCADNTILVVKMPTNTKGFESNVAVVYGSSCRREMCKNLLFYDKFHTG